MKKRNQISKIILKKFIFLLFTFMIFTSYLRADSRWVEIEIYSDVSKINDCYIFINSYEKYLEKVDETVMGDDIAVLRDTQTLYNYNYNGTGIVVPPLTINIELDDGDYPNGTTQIWGQGDVGFYYPDQSYYAIGNDVLQSDEAFVEVTSASYPPVGYTYRTSALSSSSWNWVSFPVLDPDYVDPIDYVLEPILDDLDEVLHQQDEIYKDNQGQWQNEIGDFRSVDGYKIDMDDDVELEVAGWLEDPSTVMYLDEDVSKGPWSPMLGIGNWIGCFVPGSTAWQTAFSQIMDEITFIKADDWSYVKGYSVPSSFCTVDYGKLYVVGVSEDCSFTWTTFGKGSNPYVKPETIIFTYEEEADYMPIFVDDTDALDGVDEIGVFLCEECIGASVIEEFPVFIPAYVENTLIKEDVELTFRTACYDDKSIMKNMSIFVYDEKEKDFIEDIVVLDNMNSALIKLGIGEDIEIPTEFSVHQNYPNPVKGTTTISFTLPEDNKEAQVTIYNIKGQIVKELEVSVSNKGFNAVWDCTDKSNKPVSSGIYFYNVTSGEYSEMKKMLLAQ